MKKGIVIVLVFVLFVCFSVVSAGSCYDNQTIMKLYSSTNSHGALWDGGGGTYSYDICYNEIFGPQYTGFDPHSCTGTNYVLSLYQTTNSHADNGGSYTNDVCYGDLMCEFDSSAGNGCTNGGEIVVRMYSLTNSHLSDAFDTNYPVKVCCTNSVGAIYWANMNGAKITSAQVGDTVKMVTSSASSGYFEVLEDDSFIIPIYDDIRVASDGDEIYGVSETGKYVGIWTITEDDSDKAKDFDDPPYEFVFKINGNYSGSLIVTGDIEDDDPIDVTLDSPKCGDAFDRSTNLPIRVSASDPDDIIDGKITIRNSAGTVVYSNSFGNEDETFYYQFDDSGNFSIIVEADNGRERVRINSNIMILKKTGASYDYGRYIAACIAEPKDYSNIPGENVYFNATTSKGIEVNASGKFNVSYADPRLSWFWEFSTGETHSTINGDPLGYRFNKRFSSPGNNWARLTLDF